MVAVRDHGCVLEKRGGCNGLSSIAEEKQVPFLAMARGLPRVESAGRLGSPAVPVTLLRGTVGLGPRGAAPALLQVVSAVCV